MGSSQVFSIDVGVFLFSFFFWALDFVGFVSVSDSVFSSGVTTGFNTGLAGRGGGGLLGLVAAVGELL